MRVCSELALRISIDFSAEQERADSGEKSDWDHDDADDHRCRGEANREH